MTRFQGEKWQYSGNKFKGQLTKGVNHGKGIQENKSCGASVF